MTSEQLVEKIFQFLGDKVHLILINSNVYRGTISNYRRIYNHDFIIIEDSKGLSTLIPLDMILSIRKQGCSK